MLTKVKFAFLEHPRAVDESYLQHMIVAIRFSGRLFLAASAAFVHAVFPFLFEKTASRMIGEMYAKTRTRGDASRGLDGQQTPWRNSNEHA